MIITVSTMRAASRVSLVHSAALKENGAGVKKKGRIATKKRAWDVGGLDQWTGEGLSDGSVAGGRGVPGTAGSGERGPWLV